MQNDFFLPATIILSLQNGWGNYDVIKNIINPEQVIVGVNYVSGTTLVPAMRAGRKPGRLHR